MKLILSTPTIGYTSGIPQQNLRKMTMNSESEATNGVNARIAKRNPRSIEGRCRVNPGLETAVALKHKINGIVCANMNHVVRRNQVF